MVARTPLNVTLHVHCLSYICVIYKVQPDATVASGWTLYMTHIWIKMHGPTNIKCLSYVGNHVVLREIYTPDLTMGVFFKHLTFKNYLKTCVYIYILIHIYVCVCIYRYVYVRIYVYMYACIHKSILWRNANITIFMCIIYLRSTQPYLLIADPE